MGSSTLEVLSGGKAIANVKAKVYPKLKLGSNGKDPGKKFRSEQIKDDVKNTYSKYYYDHGKLVGVILVGDISGMGAAIAKMK